MKITPKETFLILFVFRLDSNIYLYRKRDYEFCILIQAEHIGAIFIKRLYCRNEKIDTNEIKWFKYTALGKIESNIERRARINQ